MSELMFTHCRQKSHYLCTYQRRIYVFAHTLRFYMTNIIHFHSCYRSGNSVYKYNLLPIDLVFFMYTCVWSGTHTLLLQLYINVFIVDFSQFWSTLNLIFTACFIYFLTFTLYSRGGLASGRHFHGSRVDNIPQTCIDITGLSDKQSE